MAHTAYFLGANSKDGFYSLMDRLIDPAKAQAIYILKGGPGCGKSSLMKRVGQAAEDAGCRPQYIYCSGDPESLDGVVIEELKVALCDGTAPHGAAPKGHTSHEKSFRKGVTAQKFVTYRRGSVKATPQKGKT